MSCLFDALSSHVRGCTSNKLRQLIAEYERRNPVMPNGLTFEQNISPTSLKRYYQWISKTDSWGGALEVSVFAMLFNVNVQVIMLHHGKSIVFSPAVKPKQYIVIKWDGSHYS